MDRNKKCEDRVSVSRRQKLIQLPVQFRGGKNGLIQIAEMMYTDKDPPPNPGQKLLDAIKSGNMKAVDDLLNDHQKNEHKQISQDHLNAALLEACRAGWKFFVHKLVRSGATVCNEQNKNCTTALHIAAQHGFLGIVNFLLHKGADVNAVDGNMNTALILAINPAGCTEILNILLAHGAEVDAQNSEGMTALMKAVEARDIDAIMILILAGADDNKRNRKGQTSTDIAMDSGISEVFKFIKYPKREKTRLCFFKSALSKAVLENNIEAVKILVDCVHRDIKFMSNCNTDYERANRAILDELVDSMCLDASRQKKPDKLKLEIATVLLESVSYEGNNSKLDVTSLVIKATQDGLYELVEILCKYEDFERHSDTTDHPALVIAAEKGLTDILKLLLSFAPVFIESHKSGNSALFSSLKNDRLDCANLLLQKRSFSNAYLYKIACHLIKQELYKALDNLVFRRNDAHFTQSLLSQAVQHGRVESVQVLINRGADVNARRVALVVALQCLEGSELFEMTQFLVKRGANINGSPPNMSPLVCAVRKGPEIVRYLLREGADINEVGDEMGNTPLIVAIPPKIISGNNSIPFCLLDFYCGYSGGNNAGQKLGVISMLLDAGADPNKVNRWGNTALHLAVARQKLGVISMLLEAGADSNKVNLQGNTALHLAVAEQKPGVISMLLEAGADPNKVNCQGDTALHLAVTAQKLGVISMLLDAGADLEVRNSHGFTPLLKAAVIGEQSIIVVLKRFGANTAALDNDGNTALCLVLRGYRALSEKILRLLSQDKDVINKQGRDGMTPLMLAAQHGYIEPIKILLELGADPNIVSRTRGEPCTALSIVLDVIDQHGALLCAEELIKHNGLASMPRRCYQDFLKMIFRDKRQMVQLMVTRGMAPLCGDVNRSDETDFILRFNDSLKHSLSPLAAALLSGRLAIAQYLVNNWFLTPVDVVGSPLLRELRRELHNEPRRLRLIDANTRNTRRRLESSSRAASLSFMDEHLSQPMSLVKLSFVAVSAALGEPAGREKRVRNTPLPTIIRDKLLFRHEIFSMDTSSELEYETSVELLDALRLNVVYSRARSKRIGLNTMRFNTQRIYTEPAINLDGQAITVKGIRGNETADKIAKAALNRASCSRKLICWSDLKPKVNAYIHTVWQENWNAEGANKLHEVLPNLGEASAKEVKEQIENGKR
ncbi:ankyrin-3 [Plakobranchus ocellatus]|uniref:Ankyrin-3 n=1 Tax=Plakobranchus ocellatus TaxID=259542 RepID=A0AAV4D7S4_9GAST|nr:ankyrin-3 [Plakobranchus ocellatus]